MPGPDCPGCAICDPAQREYDERSYDQMVENDAIEEDARFEAERDQRRTDAWVEAQTNPASDDVPFDARRTLPLSGWYDLKPGESVALLVLVDEPADTLVTIAVDPRMAADIIAAAMSAAPVASASPLVTYEPWQVITSRKREWHEYRRGEDHARND